MSAPARTDRASASTPSRRWHELSAEQALPALGSDPERGLGEQEAARRLSEQGPNAIEDRGGRTLVQILWEQVSSVMIWILLVAAALAAALGKPVDAAAILAIVVLFVVLGIVQEYRAQKAIAALKQMAAPTVRVVREGRVREMSARELVPGDVVRLEAGAVVPADCRMLESASLRTQEAALTGESEPVDKTVAALGGAATAVGDRTNMAFMGTSATFGRGTALVVATGMATELGRIAELIQEVEHEETPLQRRLDGLAKTLAGIAVAIAALVLASGLLRGEDATLMLLTAVSLAVAIVPEGLPAVLTFTLALGAQRMLGRKALIRRLPAVETLGSVTVICSDKTGTLTQNRMTVTVLETLDSRLELPGGEPPPGLDRPLCALLAASALCNDAALDRSDGAAPSAVGDPTEGALVVAAAGAGLDKEDLEAALPRVEELPFDSDRKRMTTVHALGARLEGKAAPALAEFAGAAPALAVTKGAGDGMLAICDRVWSNGQAQPLDAQGRQRLSQALEALTRDGVRVLAVACRGAETGPRAPAEELERDLVLLGFVGMVDPPRSEARDAVARCASAGIRPVMITGDHPLTARAIASQLGMASPDGRTVTGAELDQMSQQALREAVREVSVFARVSPEHKLRIVQALQQEGEVVAMTGDGVNDAPALKKAQIGVAMGTGTDVAKEAADVVLLDDNFATIVAAVEEGRVVYDNVRRFVRFSVSGNVGKVLIVAVPPLFGLPLFLLPIMILFSNLLTDGLLGLGLGVERAEPDTMRRPPVSPSESIFSRGVGRYVATIGPLIGAVTIAVGWWTFERAGGSGAVSESEELAVATMVFTTLALIQIAQALSARSFSEPVWATGLRGNPVLLAMLAAVLVLQLSVVYLPPAQEVFSTVPLAGWELAVGAAAALLVLAAMELEKRRRPRTRPGVPPAEA